MQSAHLWIEVQNMTIMASEFKICVTTTCCSVGIFGVEIWSETTCNYFTVEEDCSMEINSPEKINENLVLDKPVLLAGLVKNKEGENMRLAIPAGQYSVKENRFKFNALKVSSEKYCWTREVSGSLFGNSYHYKIKLCVSFSLDARFENNNNGIVELNTNLDKDQINKVIENNEKIVFNEDIKFEKKEVDFILKKGEYILNKDGFIYLQNIKVK